MPSRQDGDFPSEIANVRPWARYDLLAPYPTSLARLALKYNGHCIKMEKPVKKKQNFHTALDAPPFNGLPLAHITDEVGTPYYIYNADYALSQLQRLKTAFGGAHIHYSLKANDNLMLLRILREAGAGFDIVSGGELYKALAAGAAPSDVVFAGVGKTDAEIAYGLEVGVGWFNVESAGELRRLERFAGEMGKLARAALRLKPDVRADTHHYIATGHASAKFGIPIGEVERILAEPGAFPNIRIEGLHTHIGSQLGSVERSAEAAQVAVSLAERFPQIRMINMGGGFPIAYEGEAVPSVEDFAAALAPVVAGYELLIEPGRYIIAEAGALIVTVIDLKAGPEGVIAICDGGMTELIRPALYGAVHPVALLAAREGKTRLTHVAGPICESADILHRGAMLPPLEVGDRLAVLCAGAYGATMGSHYNARPCPPEIIVRGEDWQMARRRESWEEMVMLERNL